jgi:hypothetical protein
LSPTLRVPGTQFIVDLMCVDMLSTPTLRVPVVLN